MDMNSVQRGILAVVAVMTLCLAVGCGTVRETLPSRSATEQLLISTAADRAVTSMPEDSLDGKKVYIDTTRLDSLDKPYVEQTVRDFVLNKNASVVPKDNADMVLEVSSGALSVDRRDYLLGIPSFPLPIPFGGEVVKFPEIPIFKALFYQGKAKMRFTSLDPASQTQVYDIPLCYGQSKDSYWWFLLLGPFRFTDLPPDGR